MKLVTRLGLLLIFHGISAGPVLAEFDHGDWDRLLKEHVVVLDDGAATQVDYAGMLGERGALQGYLQSLAAVPRAEFDAWPLAEQLAFLINSYNGWTVELILTEYPDIDSIRDIGFLFAAAWSRPIVSLFGEQVSLDDVEHGMIRGWDRFQEPRIHFAVNCAAIGCPALRAEAYRGDSLAEQLDDNTRLFLGDRSRNYYDRDRQRLYVSRIFSWYEEDFEQGWQGFHSVAEFLAHYGDALELDPPVVERLSAGRVSIRYLRYDWDLNRL